MGEMIALYKKNGIHVPIRVDHVPAMAGETETTCYTAPGHMDVEYVERFFSRLSGRKACSLFHNITYHDYVYNPDSNKLAVYKMRQIVEKYAPGLLLRQGENGAPSVPEAGGAMAGCQWSELSQAKSHIMPYSMSRAFLTTHENVFGEQDTNSASMKAIWINTG